MFRNGSVPVATLRYISAVRVIQQYLSFTDTFSFYSADLTDFTLQTTHPWGVNKHTPNVKGVG